MEVKKPTVLWVDGCFDGFHYAHANAIRQCLRIVDGPVEIVLGVHSDAEITRNKGPPLFDEEERYAAIRECRWVSRVVDDVPYATQPDVFKKYSVDFIVHGDDPAMDADGNDCYAIPKALGKFLECKRTDGISSTSLIQRVLSPSTRVNADETALRSLLSAFAASCNPALPIFDYGSPQTENQDEWEALLASSASKDCREPIAYVGGQWDCFGSGHAALLRRSREAVAQDIASAHGVSTRAEDVRLVVGVWTDQDVEQESGEKPLLTMLERALALAQCRYTAALLLNAPRELGEIKLRDTLNIGTGPASITYVGLPGQKRPKGLSEHMNVVEVLPSEVDRQIYSVAILREKVLQSRDAYEERQRRKGV